MKNDSQIEWSFDVQRGITFHLARYHGRTVALIRESQNGITLQCAGYALAELHSARYRTAQSLDAAFAICEIHGKKQKPIRNTQRRGSLIGRNLQTDRETPIEDEDDSSWAC